MLAEQFTAAAAAARNTAAVDEVARLTWRAHAEGQLADADAEAVSTALQARRRLFSQGRVFLRHPRHQGPPLAFLGPPDASLDHLIAEPLSSAVDVRP